MNMRMTVLLTSVMCVIAIAGPAHAQSILPATQPSQLSDGNRPSFWYWLTPQTYDRPELVQRFKIAARDYYYAFTELLKEKMPDRPQTAASKQPATRPIAVNADVERALLANDWERAYARLGGISNQNLVGVERFLKGHACLATNRNNASVMLLRESPDGNDAVQWEAWATDFAVRNPQSATGDYLKGDALARAGRHEQAIQAFTDALRIDPRDALALNARGVCYASMGKWDEAYADLAAAKKLRPDLADISANHGDLNVRRSLGAPGALAEFDGALKISPDFTLAKIGRASALFALGKWTDAQTLIDSCKAAPDSRAVAVMNSAVIRESTSKAEIAMLGDPPPGTEIDRQLSTLEARANADNQQILHSDYMANAATFAHDMFHDLGAPLDAGMRTLQSAMNFRAGNFNDGMDNAMHVLGTINDNNMQIADSARSLAQMDSTLQTNAWHNDISNIMSLRNSGLTGGVETEDLRRGYVDRGNWNLFARFALQYPDVRSFSKPAVASSANVKEKP